MENRLMRKYKLNLFQIASEAKFHMLIIRQQILRVFKRSDKNTPSKLHPVLNQLWNKTKEGKEEADGRRKYHFCCG